MSLSLTDVDLFYPSATGETRVLNDVSFSLPAGRSVAIVGPSGSGKTSLLMIAAGLLKPSKGRITIDGEDITGHDEDRLAVLRRQKMGIVFQSFHLIPTMTALENVMIPMELSGMQDHEERAASGLSAVGLGHRLNHYPAQMSGGEQQRVAIARALSMSPSLILADEPTGNLDQETGKGIMDLLFSSVRSRGATLVLITHDEAIAAACDEKIHIRDGKIAAG